MYIMKVKKDIFSRKVLKPLFNAIADSKLSGVGILDPHGNYDVDLLLAGEKPIVKLYDDIKEEHLSLKESIIEELAELKEEPHSADLKKEIKYIEKELSDLDKLNRAVEEGSILKKSFRVTGAYQEAGHISHEEFYYLPTQAAQMKEIEESYNNLDEYGEPQLPAGKDIGQYLGYSDADIRKFQDAIRNQKVMSPLEDGINSIKRWCRIRSLLIK